MTTKTIMEVLHQAPSEQYCQENESQEPEGERLRGELIEWLKRNRIVAISLDTPEHIVDIQSAPRLPPCIKPVLTKWGSIYVVDELS